MTSQISAQRFVDRSISQKPYGKINQYIQPLMEQDYISEKDTISYPLIREFPYIRVKWNMKNFLMGLFVTILSNVIIAIANESAGAKMPTYLLISSISNIAFNLAIFDWLFDMKLFRIFLVPLFPLFPLLIYVIATQVSPELRLFNYLWHSIHFFYIIHSVITKKYCTWRYVPFTIGFWVVYMIIMKFILLPLDSAITSVLIAGMIMTAVLYKTHL
jgi:hypothetical protein